MSKQFISAPWHIEKPDGYNQLTWNILYNDGWICELYHDKDPKITEARANIIAAAPDVYEALKIAKETIHSQHVIMCIRLPDGGKKIWELYQQSPEMKKINEAIEKANPTK